MQTSWENDKENPLPLMNQLCFQQRKLITFLNNIYWNGGGGGSGGGGGGGIEV